MLPYVCQPCQDELIQFKADHIEMFGSHRVRVLFHYDGMIRTLIGRSKIRNDAIAAGLLCRVAKSLLTDELVSFGDAGSLVIPMPPSFWGRVRGRFDLAELLAKSLFPKSQVYSGSVEGFAVRRKRAGRNTSIPGNSIFNRYIYDYFKDSNGTLRLQRYLSSRSRILVVDDVMTTGLTMRTIFNQLMELGAQSIEGLVIASSS